MEYLFALLGLLCFLLIDLGALNRATPEINLVETIQVYLTKNLLYIFLCLIILFVVVYLKGELPLVPEQFLIVQGKSALAIAFLWGLGIQFILIQVRKFVSPLEVKPN